MKPIVLFIIAKQNESGNFIFTQEELKQYLENAYNQGYEQAKKDYCSLNNCYPLGYGTGVVHTRGNIDSAKESNNSIYTTSNGNQEEIKF